MNIERKFAAYCESLIAKGFLTEAAAQVTITGDSTVVVKGGYTAQSDLVKIFDEWFAMRGFDATVLMFQGLTYDQELQLDEVATSYLGEMPLRQIKPSKQAFIKKKPTLVANLERFLRVIPVMTPIVLDAHNDIIDGYVRYEVAKKLGWIYVPVVKVEAEGAKADALTLGLNRSAEYQRWNWDDVDKFVDEAPVWLQNILEPLGFFGTTVLPTSFFSNNMWNYRIDPFNEQQSKYAQAPEVEHAGLEKDAREYRVRDHQQRLASIADGGAIDTPSLLFKPPVRHTPALPFELFELSPAVDPLRGPGRMVMTANDSTWLHDKRGVRKLY